MKESEHTEQIDGVQYELVVRDESTGYFGSWFCRECRTGGAKYDLVSTIDDALAEARRLSLVHHRCEHQSLPESLVISLDNQHNDAVVEWWRTLTNEERGEFLDIAALTPSKIADPVPAECSEVDDGTPNEWYEYIINQDARFYFDRSDPQGNYNLVYPIVTPISNAADIEVVSHLLTNPRRRNDG
ncbi:hypothetical protein [Allorhodopirellula solitaria]|uniref:Uncharacterized protein n=1 Tax=Allorhodopirellula solitaria TaxID=2527987 RepID=A0A5C5YE40_9BACT|nr:hypothetical protein [Allorhodopirellula solitaria]TWT73083.1 hypothetical protein CA85_15490 [Allorhodopirellula solitaria]